MSITQSDLDNINTHGFETKLDEHGYLTVDMPMVTITINKRPYYCDRGRYGFFAEVKPGFHHIINVDEADAFPRYFFSLQRGFDEMKDWEDFRNQVYSIKQ